MEEEKVTKLLWKRRVFLINERLQAHFIIFTASIALVACLFFYISSEYFFMRYHAFAVDVGLKPQDPFFRVLTNMENLLTYIFGFTSVCVVIASIMGGLLFSHRVAGPMHRMRLHLEAVARGETWGNVSFRTKDYFSEVAEAYNASMSAIRQKTGLEAGSDQENTVEKTEQTRKAG